MVTNACTIRPGIRTAAVLLASASFGLASMASAQKTDDDTLVVSAAVTSNCHLTGGTIPFGDIDVTLGREVDHDGSLIVRCTNGTDYSVTADKGLGDAATVTDRKLTGTTDTNNVLKYALYKDGGHSQNWGETAGSDDIVGQGTGIDQPYTIYGRVLANQPTVKKDTYGDTVTVTVTYN